MAKLIFGCGYLGLRVAGRWVAAGEQVFALTRSQARAAELEQSGIHPLIGDVTGSFSLADLVDIDTALFCVGFDRDAGKSIQEVYVGGLQRALQALPDTTRRVIYISSTGVYGQTDGEWVDEQSACRPRREAARACLAAEQVLAADRLADRSIVLRLAGIYGPGRIPRMRDVACGKPLAAPGDAFLNLVHVDDAVEVVLAADRRATPPALYVVADGCPVRRAEFYGTLARLLGCRPPQFEPPPQPTGRAVTSEKRIRNTRVRSELLPEFKYPSYREGLAAIVREGVA